MSLFEEVNKFVHSWLEEPLKRWVNPFITPFFVILNYFYLVSFSTEDKNKDDWDKTWLGKIFLVVSIIYFLLTVVLALIKAFKFQPPQSWLDSSVKTKVN